MPYVSIGPVLPPELTDEIISAIGDDKETLAYSSLVCTSWLQRSRKCLFRRVKLGHPLVAAFLEFISTCQERSGTDPSTSPAHHITELSLAESDSAGRGRDLYVAELLLMFGLLPNLQQLNISQGTLIASAGGCSTPMSQLTELRILNTHVHSDTPQALLQLLSAFVHVDHLYISCLSWRGVPANSEDAAASSVFAVRSGFPSHLQVSSLTVIEDGQPFIPALLVLMRCTASVHTVTDLRLQCSDARSVVAIAAFLSYPGIAIQSLSLDLAFPTRGVIYTPYEPAVWRQLNLREVHSLRHLRVVVQLELSRGMQYVADQFMTATSVVDDCADALESVTFFVWVDLQPRYTLPCLYNLASEFVWLRSTLIKKAALRKVRWLWAAPERRFEFAEQRAAVDVIVRSKLAGLQSGCGLDIGTWVEADTSLGAWLREI